MRNADPPKSLPRSLASSSCGQCVRVAAPLIDLPSISHRCPAVSPLWQFATIKGPGRRLLFAQVCLVCSQRHSYASLRTQPAYQRFARWSICLQAKFAAATKVLLQLITHRLASFIGWDVKVFPVLPNSRLDPLYIWPFLDRRRVKFLADMLHTDPL